MDHGGSGRGPAPPPVDPGWASVPAAREETAMTVSSGAAYAPAPIPSPVVGPGEFVFGAARLDHGHIYGVCQGLVGAGGTLKWVYDPDPAKVDAFRQKFPEVRVARTEEEILDDQ